MCIYCVRSGSLCPLSDPSSKAPARFGWRALIPLHTLPSFSSLPSALPLQGVLLLVPWLFSARWLIDVYIHLFVRILIHWENIWAPDHNWSHWFISSLYFHSFAKSFFVLDSLLSLYLTPQILQISSVLHKIFSFYEKKRWFVFSKDFIMSLFHKSIRFSKVPFKLKKKKLRVNSDILQLT